MNTKTVEMIKIAAMVFLALAILSLAAIFLTQKEDNVVAGVNTGEEYKANSVTSASVGTSSVKSTFGAVGNVVVSSTSPVTSVGPYIVFYDTASTTISTTSMTAKIKFGATGAVTPAAGTYQFDVAFDNGIYMWVAPAFNGNYTVTYK